LVHVRHGQNHFSSFSPSPPVGQVSLEKWHWSHWQGTPFLVSVTRNEAIFQRLFHHGARKNKPNLDLLTLDLHNTAHSSLSYSC
jgi:hypothetical protein